ncbi:hypothetical protein FGO68_gene9692 [Halteria grandinella]|uniref:Uncharacterized protein n=1 Tax=Halteria grandinella TaxID=5974 RepID=A0A8J8T5E5_HALGN|nr:hypothetical protein FGO68_gene9692 [Halteria grandinella]
MIAIAIISEGVTPLRFFHNSNIREFIIINILKNETKIKFYCHWNLILGLISISHFHHFIQWSPLHILEGQVPNILQQTLGTSRLSSLHLQMDLFLAFLISPKLMEVGRMRYQWKLWIGEGFLSLKRKYCLCYLLVSNFQLKQSIAKDGCSLTLNSLQQTNLLLLILEIDLKLYLRDGIASQLLLLSILSQ